MGRAAHSSPLLGSLSDLEVPVLTIGLVLLLAAAVVVVDVLLENSWHANVTIVGQEVHLAFWEFAVAGVVIGLVLALGFWIAMVGARQQASLRRERRRLRRELRRRPAAPAAPVERPAAQVERPAAAVGSTDGTGVVPARAAYPDDAPPPAPRARHRRGAGTASPDGAPPAG